jgi:hypothetical protein
VFWFPIQCLSEIFLLLNRTERYMIKNVYWSSCKVPVIVVKLKWKLNFHANHSGNTQMSDFKEIYPVRAESFHTHRRTDRQTGMTKLIADLCNFADVPKCNDENSGKWPNLTRSFFYNMSSTCFKQLCAHHQEDNCINATSGITTLKTIE